MKMPRFVKATDPDESSASWEELDHRLLASSRLNHQLNKAVIQCDIELVKKLVSEGAEPSQVSILDGLYDDNPLHTACRKSHLPITQVLCDAECTDLNRKNKRGQTALHIVAHNGNEDLLEVLLKAGANPNLQDELGRTVLMVACRNKGMVDMILSTNCDVNIKDTFGFTVLMDVASTGNVEIADKLVSFGAEVNATDFDGFTALMLASKWAQEDMVNFLLSRGANCKAVASNGNTALHECAGMAYADKILQTMVDHGCDPDTKNVRGHTALFYAVELCQPECVKILLQSGCNPYLKFAQFDKHFTAFELCIMQCHQLARRCFNDSAVFVSSLEREDLEKFLRTTNLLYTAGCGDEEVCHYKQELLVIKQFVKIYRPLPENNIIHVVLDLVHTPRTLQNSCIIQIRKILGTNINQHVHQVGLPECLKQMLLLSELEEI